jgi:hypothetical protein
MERSQTSRDERTRIVLESAELGIWSYDPVVGIFAADARTKTIHGRDAQAPMTCEHLIAAIDPADREAISVLLADTPPIGKPLRLEARTRWLDRSIHSVSYEGRQ